MRWFGESWDAPVCEEGEEVDVPAGGECGFCNLEIQPGDRGLILATLAPGGDWEDFPIHYECLINVTGIGLKVPHGEAL